MKKKKLLLCVLLFSAILMCVPYKPVKASSVKLNSNLITTIVGKTYQLKLKGTRKKVKWTTSNKKIAVVSRKGKVTAKAVGSTTITAKVGKKKYKCKVYIGKKQLVNKKNISVYYIKTTKKGISLFAKNKMSKSKKAKMRLTMNNYALDGQTPEGKRSGNWEAYITPGKVKTFTLNYSKGIRNLSHKYLSLYAVYGLYYSDGMDAYDISCANKVIGTRYQPDNNYSGLQVLSENKAAKLYYYKLEKSNLIVFRLENKTKEGLYGFMNLTINGKMVGQRVYDDPLVAPKSSANIYILMDNKFQSVQSLAGVFDLETSNSCKEYKMNFNKRFAN